MWHANHFQATAHLGRHLGTTSTIGKEDESRNTPGHCRAAPKLLSYPPVLESSRLRRRLRHSMHCRLSLPPAAPAPAPALHFRVFRPAFSRCSWVFANQTMLRFYCNGGLAHTFDLTPRRNPQQLVGALLSSGGPPLGAFSDGDLVRQANHSVADTGTTSGSLVPGPNTTNPNIPRGQAAWDFPFHPRFAELLRVGANLQCQPAAHFSPLFASAGDGNILAVCALSPI